MDETSFVAESIFDIIALDTRANLKCALNCAIGRLAYKVSADSKTTFPYYCNLFQGELSAKTDKIESRGICPYNNNSNININ
ncbi:MAG: hypothetical protein WCK31_00885 [bacterium]